MTLLIIDESGEVLKKQGGPTYDIIEAVEAGVADLFRFEGGEIHRYNSQANNWELVEDYEE